MKDRILALVASDRLHEESALEMRRRDDRNGQVLDGSRPQSDILDTYGWALSRAGRYQEAVRVLERAYGARPEMYCIEYHPGSAYLAVNDRIRAEGHFRRQLALEKTRGAGFVRQALQRMGVDVE